MDDDPHSMAEQRTFTDGRIVVLGNSIRRRNPKRADYLLRYTRDFLVAVVEAKAAYKTAGDGLQQAKDYAEILGLKFAYATNGHNILEFDFLTGKETALSSFRLPMNFGGDYALRKDCKMKIWRNACFLRPTTFQA